MRHEGNKEYKTHLTRGSMPKHSRYSKACLECCITKRIPQKTAAYSHWVKGMHILQGNACLAASHGQWPTLRIQISSSSFSRDSEQ